MNEEVYVNTGSDLTKKVRYGRGERQMEMEERGEREEPIEDIYLYPDDQEPIYATAEDYQDQIYVTPIDQDPVFVSPGELDPGTQQDAAAQKNTAQEQQGGSEDSKQNCYMAAAVCVGLGLLLLAGIFILVIYYCVLIKEKHILQSSFDQLQNRHDNLTGLNDQLKTRLDNMTELNDQWKTSFDDLQTRLNNMTELKRIHCESHGFTFGDGVCYYLSTEKKTWVESRTYCRDNQSDLIIIKSKEKQDFVQRVVGNKDAWLGLSDRETEGVWKWVDGTPLTTPTYWRPGEPNNDIGGEDCAHEGYGIGWNDAPCASKSYNRNWICEIVM